MTTRLLGPDLDSATADAVRTALGSVLDLRIDPMAVDTRHRLSRAAGRERAPFLWCEPWRVVPFDTDREVRFTTDVVGARGNPERSRSFVEQLVRIRRGGFGRVGFVPIATEADLRWHFGCCHRLAQSIATVGFLDRDDVRLADAPPGRHPELEADNPRVSVDGDGRPHWSGDGRHRVAIARAFGLRSIPVTVRSIDAAWAAARSPCGGDDLLSAIGDRLDEISAATVEDAGWSDEWLRSLDDAFDFPDARPDVDETNAVVERALRLDRDDRLDEALEQWASIGAISDVRPYINVLAARTAHRAGRIDLARRRVDAVLLAMPDHLAAREMAAEIAHSG